MKIIGKYEGIIEIINFYTNPLGDRIFTQYYSSIKIKHVNDYSFYNTTHLFYDETNMNSNEYVFDYYTKDLYKYNDNDQLYYNTNKNGSGFRLISIT